MDGRLLCVPSFIRLYTHMAFNLLVHRIACNYIHWTKVLDEDDIGEDRPSFSFYRLLARAQYILCTLSRSVHFT